MKLLNNSLKNTVSKNFMVNKSCGFAFKNSPFKDDSFKNMDPEFYDLLMKEQERQFIGLELIASENYAGKAVLEVLGSVLCNKYSEGQPGARYYGGNQYIDQIENITKKRALEAFGFDPSKYGVNVQALSGSPANLSVYTGLLNAGDRIMGLHLYNGGHLTHGFRIDDRPISSTAKFFKSEFYYTDPKTNLIDYDDMERRVKEFKPHLLIVGGSCYNRDYDYVRFRKAADSVGAYLHADISHFSGLVATGEHNNPFPYADTIMTTTHKTLRGPRGSLIFYNKERHPDIGDKVDFGVFPMIHGGPHNNQTAAIGSHMLQIKTPEFKEYCKQIKRNARALSEAMTKRGLTLVGDTENHLVVWDVRTSGLTGNKAEKGLDLVHITTNKNTIPGDKSAMNPGGVRLGTPAITTRGLKEKDMENVAEFMKRYIDIAQPHCSHKKLVDFVKALKEDKEIHRLGEDVKAFSTQFSIPGVPEYNNKI